LPSGWGLQQLIVTGVLKNGMKTDLTIRSWAVDTPSIAPLEAMSAFSHLRPGDTSVSRDFLQTFRDSECFGECSRLRSISVIRHCSNQRRREAASSGAGSFRQTENVVDLTATVDWPVI